MLKVKVKGHIILIQMIFRPFSNKLGSKSEGRHNYLCSLKRSNV